MTARSTRGRSTSALGLPLLWLMCTVSSASAQAPTPTPQTPPSETSGGVPQQSARHSDAHADRVILVPSAETHPAGTLFASIYEIVLLSVGYALTDRLQASITATANGKAAFAELNLKANLLRSRYLRVAVLSGIDYIRGQNGDSLIFGRVGSTGQLCFELACRTSLSLHAMLVVHDEPDTVLPVGLGAGFTAYVSSDVTALLEYSVLINASRDLPLITLPIYLVAYGIRISAHPSWALDLTMIRRMQSSEQVRTGRPSLFDLLGVPLLAFTYRGKP